MHPLTRGELGVSHGILGRILVIHLGLVEQIRILLCRVEPIRLPRCGNAAEGCLLQNLVDLLEAIAASIGRTVLKRVAHTPHAGYKVSWLACFYTYADVAAAHPAAVAVPSLKLVITGNVTDIIHVFDTSANRHLELILVVVWPLAAPVSKVSVAVGCDIVQACE